MGHSPVVTTCVKPPLTKPQLSAADTIADYQKDTAGEQP